MKTLKIKLALAGILVVGSALNSLSSKLYVNVNNAASASPFTNWVSAATNIQQAVDAAAAGDDIVVTNGIYATGRADSG